MRAWLFIAATFALTWACQTPGILVLRANEAVPAIVVAVMALGSAGPSLVALWFRVLERGALRLRPPAHRSWSRPIWQLWLVALAFSPAAHLLGSAVSAMFGFYQAKHLVYPPLLPEQIAIAVVAPLGEEFGWRGYALPRLQARWSPIAASLWIGLFWALWHIPTLFVPAARGTSSLELGLYLLSFLASSVVYTWLFNAGGGSVIAPILAHLGIHLDNVFRASTLGDGVTPLLVSALAMTAFAALLILTGQLRRETAVVASSAQLALCVPMSYLEGQGVPVVRVVSRRHGPGRSADPRLPAGQPGRAGGPALRRHPAVDQRHPDAGMGGPVSGAAPIDGPAPGSRLPQRPRIRGLDGPAEPCAHAPRGARPAGGSAGPERKRRNFRNLGRLT